jgi:hypothetical protein
MFASVCHVFAMCLPFLAMSCRVFATLCNVFSNVLVLVLSSPARFATSLHLAVAALQGHSAFAALQGNIDNFNSKVIAAWSDLYHSWVMKHVIVDCFVGWHFWARSFIASAAFLRGRFASLC